MELFGTTQGVLQTSYYLPNLVTFGSLEGNQFVVHKGMAVTNSERIPLLVFFLILMLEK